MPNEPISAFEHSVIHALEELRRELLVNRSILVILATKRDLEKAERRTIQSIQNQLNDDSIKLLEDLLKADRKSVEKLEKLAAKTPNK